MPPGLLLTRGLPAIALGTFTRDVNRVTNIGKTVVPFSYFYPYYLAATQSGRHDAAFTADPRIFKRAELLSVSFKMPTIDFAGNLTPQASTVFKLFTSLGNIQFTMLSTDREIEFNAITTNSLPWVFWQGSQSTPFEPLKLAVVSCGTLPGTRPHQRVQVTAHISLQLRDGATL